MKKKILSLALALVMVLMLVPAMATVAQAAPPSGSIIQDPNFYAAVLEILGKADGYVVSPSDVSGITRLDVEGRNIGSLSGIEHFTALTRLDCTDNQLTSLDISKNTALKWLYVSNNQLTELDIGNNTELVNLYCFMNAITTLDVSGNTALEMLLCYGNQISALDVSYNAALKTLNCYNNPLTALDLSGTAALEVLYCWNTQLTRLDLSKNAALTTVRCHRNQLTELVLGDNAAMTKLECSDNQLAALDLRGCVALETLLCAYNLLTTLDVSRNTALSVLSCDDNQLTALDVTGLDRLTRLSVQSNYIRSIHDVTGRSPNLSEGYFLFYWQHDPSNMSEFVGYLRVPEYQQTEIHEQNLYDSNNTDVKKRAIALVSDGKLAFDDEVVALARSITEGLSSDYEKAKAIHLWVAENVVYDRDVSSDISKSYLRGTSATRQNNKEPLDVMTHKRAVCEGFARLNAALLCASGIPAVYVSGSEVTFGYTALGHAWNELYIDGAWMYSDVTNDCRYFYEKGAITTRFNDDNYWTGLDRFDYPLEMISHSYRLFEFSLVGTTLQVEAPNLDTADDWAKVGIQEAFDKDFIPADIQGSYTNIITRAEFCRMAVKWLEYRLGKDIDAILSEKGVTRDPNAFTDTSDPDILAAFALGITNGTGDGKFSPDGEFNREQAATMIRNTCKAVGMDTSGAPTSDFVDLNEASNWAVDGINFVRANGIMQGVGNGKYDPKATFTRQQSILTFNNID